MIRQQREQQSNPNWVSVKSWQVIRWLNPVYWKETVALSTTGYRGLKTAHLGGARSPVQIRRHSECWTVFQPG